LHTQTVFANLGQDPSLFPNSRKAAETVLSLPMHPYLRNNEVATVCKIVKQSQWWGERSGVGDGLYQKRWKMCLFPGALVN